MDSFLNKVEITKGDRIKYLPVLSNWLSLAPKLQTKEFSDEELLLKLIKLEIQTKKRVQIIYRLKTKYNTLRNKREMNEILKGMTQ